MTLVNMILFNIKDKIQILTALRYKIKSSYIFRIYQQVEPPPPPPKGKPKPAYCYM